jgi:hypothetical protein
MSRNAKSARQGTPKSAKAGSRTARAYGGATAAKVFGAKLAGTPEFKGPYSELRKALTSDHKAFSKAFEGWNIISYSFKDPISLGALKLPDPHATEGEPKAIEREKQQLARDLHHFKCHKQIAFEEKQAASKLMHLAWEQLADAPPIRVSLVVPWLEVSDHTITTWCRRGILEELQSSPRRLSLISVVAVRSALDQLRQAGRDRDLTNALINRIELDELNKDQGFRESLEQAGRGERGEWPEDF